MCNRVAILCSMKPVIPQSSLGTT